MSNRLSSAALAVGIAVTGLAAGIAEPAAYGQDGPGSGGTNNTVMVVNHHNGALKARSRVVVSFDTGGTVSNRNVAEARASCVSCSTLAAAIQVVVEEGNPNYVAPTNVALALNQSCQRCHTFAYANQVLVQATGRVKMSEQGRSQLAGLQEDAAQILRSGVSSAQMASELDNVTHEVVSLVKAQLASSAQQSHTGSDHRQVETRDS